MTREEISAFFPFKLLPSGDLINGPHLGAGSYAVPTLAWLRGPFWDYFRGDLWDRNLDKWRVRWACREFARAYASKAQECWAKTMGGTSDDAVAVGEFWFDPERTPVIDGHAICPCFTDHGLVYIDPQDNQIWPISTQEFDSRSFVRF